MNKEMAVKEGIIYTIGEFECPHCGKHCLIKSNCSDKKARKKRHWIE